MDCGIDGQETDKGDSIVWIRTDPAGSSAPKLAIGRLSNLNKKKQKLGMWKTAQKPAENTTTPPCVKDNAPAKSPKI